MYPAFMRHGTRPRRVSGQKIGGGKRGGKRAGKRAGNRAGIRAGIRVGMGAETKWRSSPTMMVSSTPRRLARCLSAKLYSQMRACAGLQAEARWVELV